MLKTCTIDRCEEPGMVQHTVKGDKYYSFCKKHWGAKYHKDTYLGDNGYKSIKVEGKWMGEHRHIMAQMLDRPLTKGESVHHKNGQRADNRPENLELWVGAIRYGQRATDIICPHCGKAYLEKSFDNNN